jgi:iron complex outermembrane recepter protein
MNSRLFGRVATRAVLAALAAAPITLGLAAGANAADLDADAGDGHATVSELLVTAPSLDVGDKPTGQTVATVTRERIANTPAFSIGDVLVTTPGVTFAQGNGPRDVSLSVRGSNARQTFGIRNIQVFEDGFPVTQPDGLARTDLTDPHAYGAIEVIQGPSSALYGNYATGGAVKFFTRTGHDIDGVELAGDGGSNNYRNVYVAAGAAGARWEYSLFASHVAGDGFTQHTSYRTTTVNALATLALTDHDRLIVKFINNDLDANLSIRLSYNQFLANPYQAGCEALAASGCASVSLFVNGFNGTKQTVSAYAADLGRNDRRTIVGGRWEHDFSDVTTGRVQLVWDNRDIKQPTGATSAVGTYPSFNLIADVTRKGMFLSRPSVLYAGAFFNTENINASTLNVPASGTATPGAPTQFVNGRHQNYGLRGRIELEAVKDWTVTLGVGAEHTTLKALASNYTYPTTATPTIALINGDRTFNNIAPEASLTYAPSSSLKLHARVGAGYGTPQATNLFVTSAGVAGNNTGLKAQSLLGVDVGGEVVLGRSLSASITGFYEFYTNELVSQSAGANLLSFTFNAPKSEHRGVEVAATWRPAPDALPGARIDLAYLYNNQVYTSYVERLSAGTFSATFDRAGNAIPGVAPHYLNARIAYDQASGPLNGLGAYAEFNVRSAWFLDNANILKAPGYTAVNLGAHYTVPKDHGPLSGLRFYVTVQNVANRVYVGSASNVSDSISSATGLQNGLTTLQASTGTIYAGPPRTVVGGVAVKF